MTLLQLKNHFPNFAPDCEKNKPDIMKKILKPIIEVLLFIVAVLIVVAIVKGIQKPVKFDTEKTQRQNVAIQRLKDIRTLETAYKTETGKFTADFDSLALFYNEGKMEIVMQIGSQDDSAAVANTEALKKKNKKITAEEMLKIYQEQGINLVFAVKSEIPVKDTLFASREDFNVDSLRYVPFSGGQEVEMDAVVKMVSGVSVPLFEAKMPYSKLLYGMDKQLIINLLDEREKSGLYEGLMVGSVSVPNNNAGNWE